MDYNELYEYLRKEKFSDQLQVLPKNFVDDVSNYLKEKRNQIGDGKDLFSDEMLKLKKQYENAVGIFKEIILRRKKKILNLVFVASETGIMKRDFGTMFSFEQNLFEKLIHAVESADAELGNLMSGSTAKTFQHKLIIISEPVSEFVSMDGSSVGPFEKGQLVNLAGQVADILVGDKKAVFVDSD
ncbi:MAG: hypothetical protein AABW79_01750 [Nanoarchaeota archaeon]